jgi:hypothetical protein
VYNFSKRALSYFFSLMKLYELDPGMLEYLEVILEAS